MPRPVFSSYYEYPGLKGRGYLNALRRKLEEFPPYIQHPCGHTVARQNIGHPNCQVSDCGSPVKGVAENHGLKAISQLITQCLQYPGSLVWVKNQLEKAKKQKYTVFPCGHSHTPNKRDPLPPNLCFTCSEPRVAYVTNLALQEVAQRVLTALDTLESS